MNPVPSAQMVDSPVVRPQDPIRLIMSAPVATLDVGATLRDVSEELTRNEIGAVLVTDGARTGLISERDVVTGMSTGCDVDLRQIGEVFTADLVWASPEDSIVDVGALMIETGIRHIPVSDHRSAIGIVSARDILKILISAAREDHRAAGLQGRGMG